MSLHIVWRWRACRVPQNISILRQNDCNGGSKDYRVTKRKNVEDKYSCKNAYIYTRYNKRVLSKLIRLNKKIIITDNYQNIFLVHAVRVGTGFGVAMGKHST